MRVNKVQSLFQGTKNQPNSGRTNGRGNKMWVSLVTTLGISAAIYGMSKYKNGKYMRPFQNMLQKINNSMPNNLVPAAINPITEFSQEIASGNLNKNNNQSK